MTATAEHRPALKKRRFRHDDPTAGDFFSGFGGLTQGIRDAGFDTIVAANHNAYKVAIHEANHPYAEHWIADLVNEASPSYHDVRMLPYVDLLAAGVSCVNHTQANSQRAYSMGVSLFDLLDPDYEERVTRSERDRATANCVLHYAQVHHPRLILVECTTELYSWGNLVPGSKKVGDGSTYRWWLKQFELLGYKHKTLYLNSRFFDVDQSRDRGYWVFWDKSIPDPDLDHRPLTHCDHCDGTYEAFQSWKTGIPRTGSVRYGKQYIYRCSRCLTEVVPPSGYALRSLDLTDLGTRIGDRAKPLAKATMARAERARQRFAEFPAVIMPAKALRGSERHPWQPLATQTSQQEAAILSTAAIMQMANTQEAPGSNSRTRTIADPCWTFPSSNSHGVLTPPVAVSVPGAVASTAAIMQTANSFEWPGSECRTRPVDQPLWTQPATPSTAVLTPPVAMAVDNYQGAPRSVADALPTQVGSETLALVSSGVLPFRKHTIPTTHAEAMPTVTSEQIPGMISAVGLIQQNEGTNKRVFGTRDPLRTITANNQHALVASGWAEPDWKDALADVAIEDCYFRMMKPSEVGSGCGFDTDLHSGTFKVWGSARDQVDGYGNAVSPAVGTWIGRRLRAALHGEPA